MQQEEQKVFIKELMYWEIAGFNIKSQNKSANKVVIEKFDKRGKKVVFLNNHEQEICTKRSSKFPEKEWQDLLYTVDVEVVKIQDTIKEYKILKIYPEETETFEEN